MAVSLELKTVVPYYLTVLELDGDQNWEGFLELCFKPSEGLATDTLSQVLENARSVLQDILDDSIRYYVPYYYFKPVNIQAASVACDWVDVCDRPIIGDI